MIESSPRSFEMPDKPRKHKALRVLGIVVLCLFALVGVFAVAFVAIPDFRRAVLNFLTQAIGQQAASNIDQAVDQFMQQLSVWVTDASNSFSQLMGELAARFQALHLDQGFNELMVRLFGPNAPTLDKLTGVLPPWPFTDDPVINAMIIVFAVCVPIMIVLVLVIRRREAAVARGEIFLPHRRGWRIWLLIIVACIATIAAAGTALLSSSLGWLAVAIGLLGFTITTLRADF